MDCKRALAEAGGDLDKAETLLRTKGIASAGKKASRATKEGIVASYIHLQGKVGVLVEVNCETDFVAKNEGFREFVKDITLHIAAAHPLYVSRDEVPPATVRIRARIYAEQAKGKPENVIAKIVAGKTRQILQHGLPARTGLHQESRSDDQGIGRVEDRGDRREHRHPAFHSLFGRGAPQPRVDPLACCGRITRTSCRRARRGEQVSRKAKPANRRFHVSGRALAVEAG